MLQLNKSWEASINILLWECPPDRWGNHNWCSLLSPLRKHWGITHSWKVCMYPHLPFPQEHFLASLKCWKNPRRFLSVLPDHGLPLVRHSKFNISFMGPWITPVFLLVPISVSCFQYFFLMSILDIFIPLSSLPTEAWPPSCPRFGLWCNLQPSHSWKGQKRQTVFA